MTLSNTVAWLVLLAAGSRGCLVRQHEGLRGVHEAAVDRAHDRGCVVQFLAARNVVEGAAGGYRLCGLEGIGAIGAAVLGIVIFKEPASVARIGYIVLIVVGILGLKVTSGH